MTRPPSTISAKATPTVPASRLHRGIEAFQAGRVNEAQRLLAKVLARAPDTLDALLIMGLLAARQGRMAEAECWFRRCIATAPGHAAAQDNLGNALMAQGRPHEAEACHREAVRLAPSYPPAWYNLGNCLTALDRLEEAEAAYRHALELAPGYLEAWVNLGNLLRERGSYPEAERIFRDLLARKPDLHEARLNLGNVYRLQYRYSEARHHYETLLRALPGHPRALLSLALVCLAEHDEANAQALIAQAEATGSAPVRDLHAARVGLYFHLRDTGALHEEVIKARAAGIDTLEFEYSLAEVLAKQGQHEAAVAIWEGILAQVSSPPRGLLGALTASQRHLCDWRSWDERIPLLVKGIQDGEGDAIEPFHALALPGLNATDLLRVARAYGQRYRGWLDRGPLHARRGRRAHDRLRIGYLSGDLRDHATARLTAGVFELHDRERFEVFAYSLAPLDDSALGQRLVAAFEHLTEVHQLPPDAAARRIRADDIDILVDMHGYTRLSRPEILAQRPAPIQVSWLAYPGTLGVPFIDYLIADPRVVPLEEADAYDEAIAYLPHCYQPMDLRRHPVPPPTRAQVGLPEEAFVFCCFNHTYKYIPQIFALWCGLLRALPSAVLWLFAPGETARTHLQEESVRLGIARERLLFAGHVPQDQHLARIALADLFLDTAPYNAHTTASDALWAGVPVLTCPGQTFPSRVAASILTAAGLPELIALDHDQYRDLALHWASHPNDLRDLRHKLVATRDRTPLFDTRGYTRALEDLYIRMWHRHQAGQAPATLAPIAPLEALAGARA
jgi:protein O-GlcNAc transferase